MEDCFGGGTRVSEVRSSRHGEESERAEGFEDVTEQAEARQVDVLVVDDDRPIRNLIRQIVQRLDVVSREACNGQEAIDEIAQKRPDVVILDLMMPRVSGWQVLQWMRENELLPGVPVVVLTAVGSKKMSGLADYPIRAIVDKPFEISELSEAIRAIVEEVR